MIHVDQDLMGHLIDGGFSLLAVILTAFVLQRQKKLIQHGTKRDDKIEEVHVLVNDNHQAALKEISSLRKQIVKLNKDAKDVALATSPPPPPEQSM